MSARTAFENQLDSSAAWVAIARKDQSQGHVNNEMNCQVGSRAYQLYVLSGNWVVKSYES